MSDESNALCIFCSEALDKASECVPLTEKGCDGIRKASLERNDTLSVTKGQRVHKLCRAKYTNPKYIVASKKSNKQAENTKKPQTRKHGSTFSFQHNCLLCGATIECHVRKMKQNPVFPVRTMDFQNSIVDICNQRKDSWGDEVYARIQQVNDLHAADAVYHQSCSVRFRFGKHKTNCDDGASEIKRGRHSLTVSDNAFF